MKNVFVIICVSLLTIYGVSIGIMFHRQNIEAQHKRDVLHKECDIKGGKWFGKDGDFINYCNMPKREQCAKKGFGITLKNGDYFGKCKDEETSMAQS